MSYQHPQGTTPMIDIYDQLKHDDEHYLLSKIEQEGQEPKICKVVESGCTNVYQGLEGTCVGARIRSLTCIRYLPACTVDNRVV